MIPASPALWTILLAAAWLAFVGLVMAVRPGTALAWLAKAASTPVIHFGELTARLAWGAAMVVWAPRSDFPVAFEVAGWFLAVTSLILCVLPRRWHGRYALYWSGKLSPRIVRALAPVPLAAAGALVIAAA